MSLDPVIIDYLIRVFTNNNNDDTENDTKTNFNTGCDSTDNDDDDSNNQQSSNINNNNKTIVLHLEEECKSAQQRVVIIRLSYDDSTTSSSCCTTDVNNVTDTYNTTTTTTDSTSGILTVIENGTIPTVWETIFFNSNNRFVIRIWYGASRWWNLHHPFFDDTNTTTGTSTGSTTTITDTNGSTSISTGTGACNNKIILQSIAQKEIWGYETAYRIFQSSNTESMIRIPKVLHSSLLNKNTTENEKNGNNTNDIFMTSSTTGSSNISWAMLEYVGKQSRMYNTNTTTGSNTTTIVESSTSNNVDLLLFDNTYVQSMIRYRDEFGYNNVQHLRWGRLPINVSIQYAELVLHTIIVPIHTYYFLHHNKNNSDSTGSNTHTNTCIENNSPITYHSMVQLYKRIYHYELEQCCDCDKQLSSSVGVLSNESLQTSFIQPLRLAIDQLEYESTNTEEIVTILSCQQPVLCHMDYQPQNLIFATTGSKTSHRHDDDIYSPNIVSILDWEEAEYADPRFDLLMICRKVCANQQQATTIWNKYNQIFSISSVTNPIEPWLKLETVHCIITLLLQLHNTSVGRNSPTKQSELIQNIKCEFQRLYWTGWEFCCLEPGSL